MFWNKLLVIILMKRLVQNQKTATNLWTRSRSDTLFRFVKNPRIIYLITFIQILDLSTNLRCVTVLVALQFKIFAEETYEEPKKMK